jgi:cell division protein FtsW (lipid II flippase)
MKLHTKRVVRWAPRILGALFVLFLGMFATDAFSREHGLWKSIADFGMHMLPALIAAAVLAVAWRRELAGAILYFVLAGFYCAWTKRLDWSLFIAGPMIVIGVLFLFSWKRAATPYRSRSDTSRRS